MANRKKKNQLLVVVLIILAAVLVITKFVGNGKADRTIPETVFNVDSSAVQDIQLKPRGSQKTVEFIKTNNGWNVKAENKNYPADKQKIAALLQEFQAVSPDRLAGTTQDDWKTFKVDDSSATFMTFDVKGQGQKSIYVGKLDFQRGSGQYGRGGSASYFVRVPGDDRVYGVTGYAPMMLNRPANTWRDSHVVKTTPDQWTKVSYIYPADSGFVLTKNGTHWNINGNPVDSAKTSQMLHKLSELRINRFDDSFMAGNNTPIYQIDATGDNGVHLHLNVFKPDTINYVVESTDAPQSFFQDTKARQMKQVMPWKTYLLKP